MSKFPLYRQHDAMQCGVACLRMVGIVLALSLLTLPQMTANLFTYSFKRIMNTF